jgi:hypothetical protein
MKMLVLNAGPKKKGKVAGCRIVGTIMLGNTRRMDEIPPRALRKAGRIGGAL